jgi:hypothetical protein
VRLLPAREHGVSLNLFSQAVILCCSSLTIDCLSVDVANSIGLLQLVSMIDPEPRYEVSSGVVAACAVGTGISNLKTREIVNLGSVRV